MAVNPTVRLIATLSNLIRRKIDSAEGGGADTCPERNSALYSRPLQEQDLFQKDIERRNLTCAAPRPRRF